MRSPNKYIIFCKFCKQILDEEYPQLKPQQKAVKAGEFWKYIPKELQNSFAIYAHNDKILKEEPKNGRLAFIHFSDLSNLHIVFDERVRDLNVDHLNHLPSQNDQPASNFGTSQTSNDDEQIFVEMYNMCINENPTL